MSTNNDIPSNFVVLYYNNFVYEPSKLIQFYDENAKIWRQSMGSSEGQGINEAKALLVPEIPQGTDFSVLSYQACPFENGYSLFVTASLTLDDKTRVLNQTFVLQNKYGRWFVVSDILNVNDISSVLPTNVETSPVKSNTKKPNTNDKSNYQNSKKQNGRKQDKFTYKYPNPQ
ncbi:hypothetical protein M9Y10_043252 [Tritrichomonas musculus]|uniref:NTF2 domain-containing protein n=1 Tax=Tritrichomonas musculus TaxID=1915356 RepID=A0ABR2JZH6_9EUKA